jgi:DNA polymerase I-like protein with 3'-5' exonuclease and polymerase domains
MIHIQTTNHDPDQCAQAIAGAHRVFVDLETTGLGRHDRIVAAGVLVGHHAHIMLTDQHRGISGINHQIPVEDLPVALAPFTTHPNLVVVMHNAVFDVAMLERAGVRVNCIVHDTMKLLKLYDSDRGHERDDETGTGSHLPRLERRFNQPLNYKLKDVGRHLLGINPLDFPGSVTTLPFNELRTYLRSDLLTTRELYRFLLHRLGQKYWNYNAGYIAPITPILVRMSILGVEADPNFIDNEANRLLEIMAKASAMHEAKFGQRLDVGDVYLRSWIYYDGLCCRKMHTGKKRQLSLRNQDLLDLRREETSSKAQESLGLIHDYKLAQSLMIRLRSLEKFIDHRTLRIHSTFNDIQSSGRVSSMRPNLQQIAKLVAREEKKEFVSVAFHDVTIKSRNALVATPGNELVSFDISQADIRVLANATDTFPFTGKAFVKRLQRRRLEQMNGNVHTYSQAMWQYFQLQNRKVVRCPHCSSVVTYTEKQAGTTVTCSICGNPVELPSRYPEFDPTATCSLAEDFRHGGGDFYTVATKRMLGRPPKDKTEREHLKQTILGIVNGMSAAGLAQRLHVEKDVAKGYMDAFAKAYPKVEAYRELTRHAFAITGESWTFAGHHRRITPHWWMVRRSQVDLFVSYKGADKLWLRVVPLRPNRFTLTCWVLRVIDAKYGSQNEGKEIYNHTVGRISNLPYRFFEDSNLIFRLPVRNVPWRMIRRVRTGREEARYEGYDKTWRQLFNHVAQGGTADIAKTMMIRSQPVCSEFDAHLLVQIHDELVFEVPKRRMGEFSRVMQHVLTQPPTEDFCVPIVVKPAFGTRFGEMTPLGPDHLSHNPLIRCWYGVVLPILKRPHGWLKRIYSWLKRLLAYAGVPAFLLLRWLRTVVLRR